MGLLNHVGNINLCIHEFEERAPVALLQKLEDLLSTGLDTLASEPK